MDSAEAEEGLERRLRLVSAVVPKDELVQVDVELGATDPRRECPRAIVASYRWRDRLGGTTDLAPRRNSVRSGCVPGTCWKPISCRPLKLLRPSV